MPSDRLAGKTKLFCLCAHARQLGSATYLPMPDSLGNGGPNRLKITTKSEQQR